MAPVPERTGASLKSWPHTGASLKSWPPCVSALGPLCTYGPTGPSLKSSALVHAAMPSLTANARQQATWLWQSMQNHQMALWYDNWVKKNYGVDPLHLDHFINCTDVAVLHLPASHLTHPPTPPTHPPILRTTHPPTHPPTHPTHSTHPPTHPTHPHTPGWVGGRRSGGWVGGWEGWWVGGWVAGWVGGWVLVVVLNDPPEAPAQPEGAPENEGLPTATWRLTRSRQERSKQAARGSTPRHRGPTLAVFLCAGGGGGGSAITEGRGCERWSGLHLCGGDGIAGGAGRDRVGEGAACKAQRGL